MSADPKPHRQTIVRAVERRWQALESWVDHRFGDETFGDEKVAHGFKPDASAIEEAPVPLAAHVTLYTVLALLIIAVLWSIFGSLDRIVVASGKVATRTPMLVMQPFTTSRIQQVRVKTGDHVKKGQLLVAFDPAFAQADVAALQHKVESLEAQVARLEAELGGGTFAARQGDGAARFTQAQIFNQEMADHAAQLKQRESRIAALNALIQTNQQSRPGIQAQRDMANRVVEIQERLHKQQAAAELDVMRARSAAVDIDLKLKNLIGDSGKLTEQRIEALQERNAYLEKWRSDHNQELVKARQDLADASETLNKAHRMKDFASMTAPVDGTVLEVADRSTGSVLREAETLVTLVPDGADLYVEANTPSRDVGYLKVGDQVRVKLEAYPFQQYGTLDGVLDVISADSITVKTGEEQSQPVYRVHVRLFDKPADLAARGIRIRPGLVASAEIKTGKRSIASYILNPVLRTADESMREP
jgi:HlyD family secretion protein